MKTTFAKTFTYYIIMIIVSFFLLSLGFTEIYRGYFYNDQKDELLKQAMKISDVYNESYIDGRFDMDAFHDEINILDKYMDYSFFVTDKDLRIITRSKDIAVHTDNVIDKFYGYNDVSEGHIQWLQGNIGDLYSNNRYILCYPINRKANVEAIAFVSVPLTALSKNINRVYIIIAFFLILSAILGFVTIYWAVSEFVMPLKRLNIAANHISRGNFDERIEVTDNIDDEMSELYKSFNLMAENLESLEERRREVVSNISHDLRSPITSIRGFLQAMLDGTITEDKYRRYLEIIYNETGRLNQLSDSILQLNTIGDVSEQLEKTVFNVNTVISDVLNLMKVRSIPKGIELRTDFSRDVMMVNADEDKVKRIIINLVDNAIKFTEKGSVTVGSHKSNHKVYISVKDTGIGLTDEEKARVFERFYKADTSRGMDKSGSGLGLAIVHEFIKAHDQTIEVKSAKGEGTEFIFTLDPALK